MKEDKNNKRPSEKAQRALDELKLNRLLTQDREAIARMVIDYDKQLREAEKVIANYDKELERKDRKIAEKEKTIEDLQNRQNPSWKYAGFDKSKNLIDKILFILERNKVSMTYQEVKEALLFLNPELNDRWSNASKAVTHLLSKACKYGALIKSKIYGNHGYYLYSLPND